MTALTVWVSLTVAVCADAHSTKSQMHKCFPVYMLLLCQHLQVVLAPSVPCGRCVCN